MFVYFKLFTIFFINVLLFVVTTLNLRKGHEALVLHLKINTLINLFPLAEDDCQIDKKIISNSNAGETQEFHCCTNVQEYPDLLDTGRIH